MKIFVLGGCGAMGKAIVRDLAEQPEVKAVVIGDLDLAKARAFAKEARSTKVAAVKVDVREPSRLARAVKGAAVLANATWYEFNVEVMRAALEVGCHYVDLGGLYHVTKKQLQLDRAFKKAGLTAVLGMGASPGITNVLAGYGASMLDAVDEIHIRTGARGGGGFAYSAKTILDEVTMKPVLFEGGKFKTVEPLSGKEAYQLPSPVGDVEGFYSIHSELATLPFTIKGVQTVTFRVAFSPSLIQKLNALVELGLLSPRPVSVGAVKISPKDFLYSYLKTLPVPPSLDEYKSLQVQVRGRRAGQPTSIIFETLVKSSERWKLRATAVWTGAPAAIVARWLGAEKVGAKGVLAPEIAVDPKPFLAELASRDFTITQREAS